MPNPELIATLAPSHGARPSKGGFCYSLVRRQMAFECITITASVPEYQAPKVVRFPSDVEHLYRDRSEGLLSGRSRHNWFQYMMETVIGHYRVDNLSYFSSQATCLSPGECSRVAESLENLLTSWRMDPAVLIKLSGQTAYSTEEVSTALCEAINMNSDNGDDILYFIGYVRAHSQFLKNSAVQKLHVVYVQYS